MKKLLILPRQGIYVLHRILTAICNYCCNNSNQAVFVTRVQFCLLNIQHTYVCIILSPNNVVPWLRPLVACLSPRRTPIWISCRINLHWNRVFTEYFAFFLSVSFHHCSILILNLIPLKNKQQSLRTFNIWKSLDREVLSHFSQPRCWTLFWS
jgi:hypothetical protein